MRIVVFTTDGLNREDGSVYYSNYLLIEAVGSLNFSEALFEEHALRDQDKWEKEVELAGYKITKPPALVIIQSY